MEAESVSAPVDPPPGPARATVSAVVICGNEETNIEACLASVAWCDEIVVVDSMSTDRTAAIARRFTDRVLQRPWPGYVAQKNFALEQARCDWILSLDADERCTPELRSAVERALAAPGDAAAFTVRRRVRYLGRWILHGGWYPDAKIRLARRGRAQWQGVDPHDKLVADGPVRPLDADLLHFPYRDFADQIRTVNHFSDVVVSGWSNARKRPSLLMMLLHPPTKFIECFVRKAGFRDGLAGLIIAAATAFYVFAKHVKHWEAAGSPRRTGEAAVALAVPALAAAALTVLLLRPPSLLSEAVEAHGGGANLEAVRSVRLTGTAALDGEQYAYEEVWTVDRIRRSWRLDGAETVVGFDGHEAWTRGDARAIDVFGGLDDVLFDGLEVRRMLLFRFPAEPRESGGALQVGIHSLVFCDGRISALRYDDRDDRDVHLFTFGDYRETGGVFLPFRWTELETPGREAKYTFATIEVNAPLSDSLFSPRR
ncbi:MAG: glycosyltransferase family 2 protein [Planctomycetes bacterium]|nr:glycosyltransferase family 2 protein [Planctomycetota bacterium]